jgi:hypothetical protein
MAHDILLRHNRRNYSFCIKPLVELWYQLLGRPVELNLEKLQHSSFKETKLKTNQTTQPNKLTNPLKGLTTSSTDTSNWRRV